MKRIVIVGGVAAGMKAAATAKRRSPELDVVVLQDEAEASYSACGMPFSLGDPDTIPHASLVVRGVERFRADGIDLRVRHRVEEVDVRAGRARVRSLETGAATVEPFDGVLFATGARPIVPDIVTEPGAPPIQPLRSLADAEALNGRLRPGGRVAIIGGGYIGLEMAEALRRRGQSVTLIEAAASLLPSFRPDAGAAVGEALARHGVSVVVGASAIGASRGGLTLSDGRFVQADFALAAIGVRPRIELAAAAGIAIGETGAIAVDAAMRTNRDGAFAAGDCAEARHAVSGKPVWLPLGDVANRQGRVAGANLAGGDDRFPGVLGTAIFKVFDLAVARTGLGPEDARRAGFDPVVVAAAARGRARYMPGSGDVHAMLVVDRTTGRVLGAEAHGPDTVDKYVDVVATAVWAGLSADDLAELDLAYAPPFSPVFAPAQVVGELARKRVSRRPSATL